MTPEPEFILRPARRTETTGSAQLQADIAEAIAKNGNYLHLVVAEVSSRNPSTGVGTILEAAEEYMAQRGGLWQVPKDGRQLMTPPASAEPGADDAESRSDSDSTGSGTQTRSGTQTPSPDQSARPGGHLLDNPLTDQDPLAELAPPPALIRPPVPAGLVSLPAALPRAQDPGTYLPEHLFRYFELRTLVTPGGHLRWTGPTLGVRPMAKLAGMANPRPAARVIYEVFHGRTLAPNQVLSRVCRSPSCVAPEHHLPVTHKAARWLTAHPEVLPAVAVLEDETPADSSPENS